MLLVAVGKFDNYSFNLLCDESVDTMRHFFAKFTEYTYTHTHTHTLSHTLQNLSRCDMHTLSYSLKYTHIHTHNGNPPNISEPFKNFT